MRLSQSDLADFLGVAQPSLSEATSEGHKCRGYPVRSWAVFDGAGRVAGYDVPERVMKRSNPSNGELELVQDGAPSLLGDTQKILSGAADAGRSWPDTVAETAGPVSANTGATAVGLQAMDVVSEHPELMIDVADILVTLGSGGIVAHATGEETSYRGLKVAGAMVGVFAVFKLLRGQGDSGSRTQAGARSLGEHRGNGQAKSEDVGRGARHLPQETSARTAREERGAVTLGTHKNR